MKHLIKILGNIAIIAVALSIIMVIALAFVYMFDEEIDTVKNTYITISIVIMWIYIIFYTIIYNIYETNRIKKEKEYKRSQAYKINVWEKHFKNEMHWKYFNDNYEYDEILDRFIKTRL